MSTEKEIVSENTDANQVASSSAPQEEGDAGAKKTDQPADPQNPNAAAADKKKRPASSPAGDKQAVEQEEEHEQPAKKQNTSSDPMDLAVLLGYAPGDKLQVLWDVETEEGGTTKTESKWWNATLEEWDGRTEDGCAIRTLSYEAMDGFDASKEDYIFISQDMISTPDSQQQLQYRRDDPERQVVWLNDEGLKNQLDAMLMGALQKHSSKFSALPPAEQARIGELLNQKKEELLTQMKEHKHRGIITEQTVQDMMLKLQSG